MKTQVGIFAKHWTPGRVKTRLAATHGEAQAAAIAKRFIETLLARLGPLADTLVVGFAPTDKQQAFVDLAGPSWRLEPQSDGDLGMRMKHYFETAFARGAHRVLLLGADSPDVPLYRLRDAFDRLATQRLVLGPTDDGGYYLIGARGEPPPVFDGMPWSSPELWQATTKQLASCGWREGADWSAIEPWYDVDDADDLRALEERLAGASDPSLQKLAASFVAKVQPSRDA